MTTHKERGFTLIELMVAVAILAILSRIAYVSYTKQTIKGNRSAAEAQLVQMAQAEERWYSTHDCYTSSTTSLKAVGSPTLSPQSGKTIYNLVVTAPTTTSSVSYILQAQPITSPSTLNSSDGKLQLTSAGAKTWDCSNNSTYSCTW